MSKNVFLLFSGFLDYQNAKVNSQSYPFFYALSNELSQYIPLHLKKKVGGGYYPQKRGNFHEETKKVCQRKNKGTRIFLFFQQITRLSNTEFIPVKNSTLYIYTGCSFENFPPRIYRKPLIKRKNAETRQKMCQRGQLFNQKLLHPLLPSAPRGHPLKNFK